MKKVLTLGLAMLFATSMFAQQGNINKNSKAARAVQQGYAMKKGPAFNGMETVAGQNLSHAIVKNDAKAPGSESEIMLTMYDLQSNCNPGARGYRMDDGTMMMTCTIAEEESFANRGCAYNYYNGSKWNWEGQDNMVKQRNVEDFRTGWPTVVPYGDGAVLCNHSSGINVFTTASRSNPEWIVNDNIVPGSEDYAWPKLAVTTDGTTTYIHLIASLQDTEGESTITSVKRWRSADGGQTWEGPFDIPGFTLTDGDSFNAENMHLCTNGTGTICILFVDQFQNPAYARSEDNGATFEHHTIYDFPFEGDFFDIPFTTPGDTLKMFSPTMGTGALDKDGVLHVVMTTSLVCRGYGIEEGYYSYWYGGGIDGILYWNENKGQVQPHSSFVNNLGTSQPTIDSTFSIVGGYESDQLEVIGALGGSFFGLWDEDFENWNIWASGEYSNDRFFYHRIFGYTVSYSPAIAIDDNGRMLVVFTTVTRNGDSGGEDQFYFRRAYAREYVPAELGYDVSGWLEETYALTDDFFYNASEITYPYVPAGNQNGALWNVFFQSDVLHGLVVNGDQDEGGQTSPSDNIIKHRVFHKYQTEGIDENEATVAHFQMSPNPAHNNVRISVEETSTIEIYNTVGQLVKVINGAQGEVNVDVTSLASGIYLVNVRNANGKATAQKLIVQ